MGAYSPVPFVDDATAERIRTDVVERTIRAMAHEGVPYRGVLYAGLMLTDAGPRVLEFNCRFGDPETQALMPRLASEPAALFLACARGELPSRRVVLRPGACVTVVLASGGYPGAYETGFEIEGLEAAERVEGTTVFHSGTAERQGRVVTAGGRVLSVSATGSSIAEARGARLRRERARLVRGDAVPGGHRGAGGEGGADMSDPAPLVGVLVGSAAELPLMQQATAILEKLELPHEIRVMSSSRSPDLVDEYARTAFDRGLKVLVCTTGISGHLAAAVAARTIVPVIGVPIATDQMGGEQALVVTAQMPSGVPVAAVGVDSAMNAAVLAAEIVGVADPDVQKRLWRFKDDLAEGLKL